MRVNLISSQSFSHRSQQGLHEAERVDVEATVCTAALLPGRVLLKGRSARQKRPCETPLNTVLVS